MIEQARLTGEHEAERPKEAARDSREGLAPAAAVIGGWSGRAVAGSRGSNPAITRAIGRLQATAGNGAVAQLLAARSSTRHRETPERVHGSRVGIQRAPVEPAAPAETPTVQTEDGGAPVPTAGEEAGAAPLGAGAPTPGPSWTKIGPPTASSFSVSGTLREAATALAARPEAGSTTTYSDLDQETYAPPDGEERITAARFTVFQEVALPTWTDKGAATTKQQAEWNRFSAAIKAHEDGHVATDRTSFANAHTKIKGQTPTDGNTIWKNLDEQAKKDNKAFDTATDSGRNTGTNINANIDEVTKVP